MSRRYGDGIIDAAEVERRDDAPEQFRWRDRRYHVRTVLTHWTESGSWWRASAVDSVGSAGSFEAVIDGLDDREREIWRVEAITGRHGDSGVFDLCFDWSRARWTVVRVHD